MADPIAFGMEDIGANAEARKLRLKKPAITDAVSPRTAFPALSLSVPSHGPNNIPLREPDAPGYSYDPAKASDVTRGMGLFDISSKVGASSSLPVGFIRSSSGAIRPAGSSTLAGSVKYTEPTGEDISTEKANPRTITSPVRPLPTLTEKPAGDGQKYYGGPQDVYAGRAGIEYLPGGIRPNVVTAMDRGIVDIRGNEQYGRPTFLNTQTQGEAPLSLTNADIPTASRSGFAQLTDPATIAAAQARKDQFSREMPSILAGIDDTNLVRDATGRVAGTRAINTVAARQALRAKTAAAQANLGIEGALKESQIRKNIAETAVEARKAAGIKDFDRAEVQRSFLQATKNPVLAGLYTDWEERKAKGTGQDFSHTATLYDPTTFEPRTVNLRGVINKEQAKDVGNILGLMEQAKQAYEKSGRGIFGPRFFQNKEAYTKTYNALMNRLMSAGVVDRQWEASLGAV